METNNKTSYLATLYLLFLALLFVSGLLSDAISELAYVLAFAMPGALGIIVIYRSKREEVIEFLHLPSKESTFLFLPTAIPIISIVMAVSMLVSAAMYFIFGTTNQVDISDNLIVALAFHAFLPAVLEEMLFRYIPLCIYGEEEGKTAILVSAIFFALVHNSFFVIPYAFVAGALFMAIDLVCHSVWPSVAVHLLNNAVSVLLIFYSDKPQLIYAIYVALILLSLVSLYFIVVKREKYKKEIKHLFSGDGVLLTKEILYLAVPTLIIAMVDLLSKI